MKELQRTITLLLTVLALTMLSSCEGIKLKRSIETANEVLPREILKGFVLSNIEYGNGIDKNAKAIVLNINVADYITDAFISMYGDWTDSERRENHHLAVANAMNIPEVKDVINLAIKRHYNIIVKMHYKVKNGLYNSVIV